MLRHILIVSVNRVTAVSHKKTLHSNHHRRVNEQAVAFMLKILCRFAGH